jgi:dipeptidyl aminopeptidase/acylaminoacyl peptidase
MRRDLAFGLLALCLAAGLGAASSGAEPPPPALTPQTPLLDPRSPGFFDYLAVDEKYRRLLVAHTGSRTFDVIDLANDSVLRQESVGEAHGIAIDIKDGKYFVGTGRPPFVVVLGRKYVVKDDQIQTGGPIDAVAFDPDNGMLYADRYDNNSIVIITGKTNKIYSTIPVGGSLEYIVYDPGSQRIYQNVESSGDVVVVDPSVNRIVATWHLAPATEPHGLAVDAATHRLFSAGANGKLAVVDTTNGQVIAAVDIAPSVDQIAFDPGLRRVYCASSIGLLSVVQETASGADHLADITVPRRTHSVAVDPVTHAVWIAYGAPDEDYVMKLLPPAAGASPAPGASAASASSPSP